MDLMTIRRKTIIDNSPHTVSASGDLLRFKTDIAAPVDKCVVNFIPMQDGSGEPSPTNIRPISGFDDIYLIRCGKNLIEPFTGTITSRGVTIEARDDGTLHASGKKTSTGTVQATSFINNGHYAGSSAAGKTTTDFKTDIALKYGGMWNPSDKKYFDIYPWDYTTNARPNKSSTSTETAVSVYYDSDVGKAYLPASHIFRMAVRCNTLNVQYDDYVFHPWVYFDDEEDESFEKPIRERVDISFGSIGTIYGGTLDLVSGTLTTDYGFMEFDGTEAWTRYGGSEDVYAYRFLLDNYVKTGLELRSCSHFTNATITTSNTAQGYGVMNSDTSVQGQLRFRPDTSVINTTTKWKNFLAEQYANGTPVQCWWRYQEPVTYQLTPQQVTTLNGTNNIWSNANGGIELKYWKR